MLLDNDLRMLIHRNAEGKPMNIVGAENGHFVDANGRWLILRGVNLGGSSKVPKEPDGRTHLREGFYDGAHVSFIGRPFPLEEADEHFARLVSWGQHFIRLLVPWEAIEHEGPGIYDAQYLDYIEGITEAAARHGISLFIDPHQDVWSRWTGGDGAPMWTLEAVGFEPRRLHSSGAALLHQEMGQKYPQMQWFSNHLRLGCATMFTLFFAGNDFAPGVLADGEPIQDFLQRHYIEAFGTLAQRLSAYPNVVGFDSLNEPGEGFIGLSDIRKSRSDFVLPGLAPTPLEAMSAGEGLATLTNEIRIKGLGLRNVGRKPLGTPGERAWKEGEICIWRRAGVWDIEGGMAVVKKPTWFAPKDNFAGSSPHAYFNEKYLKPFIERYAAHIDTVSAHGRRTPRFMIFIESSPMGDMPTIRPDAFKQDAINQGTINQGTINQSAINQSAAWNFVNATHWYDALTLTMKRWTGFIAYDSATQKVIIGPRAVRRYFKEALARIATHSKEYMGNAPTLIGEFGLPFDINDGHAYRTGDFKIHERALSAYCDGLDANLLSATIWNYTADNTHAYGDGWNGEDLSVFCREDGGGRALAGFVRPYALAVAGKIALMKFNQKRGTFMLEFEPDKRIKVPTEIFVPGLQFLDGADIVLSGGHIMALPNSSSAMLKEEKEPPGLSAKAAKHYVLSGLEDRSFEILQIVADPYAQLCSLSVLPIVSRTLQKAGRRTLRHARSPADTQQRF